MPQQHARGAITSGLGSPQKTFNTKNTKDTKKHKENSYTTCMNRRILNGSTFEWFFFVIFVVFVIFVFNGLDS